MIGGLFVISTRILDMDTITIDEHLLLAAATAAPPPLANLAQAKCTDLEKLSQISLMQLHLSPQSKVLI